MNEVEKLQRLLRDLPPNKRRVFGHLMKNSAGAEHTCKDLQHYCSSCKILMCHVCYAKHLKEVHHTKEPQEQSLRVTAKVSTRPNRAKCPVCNETMHVKAVAKHLKDKHSAASSSKVEKLPTIALEVEEERYVKAALTSKGRIECCGVFRSQEMHQMHLKRHAAHDEKKRNSTKKSNAPEVHWMEKLSPEELLALYRRMMNEK